MAYSSRLSIVIIDDSPTICKLLEITLTGVGHHVTCFQQSVEALRSLKTGKTPRPDLFFIDLALPMINGYEVIRLLRETPAFGQVPIVVISRLDGATIRLRVRLAGADAYLGKPFQIQDVMAIIQHVETLPSSTIHTLKK